MLIPGLTDEELLELLDIARKSFSNDYIPLHDTKIAAIKKCADLVAIDRSSIVRNALKSRAHTILTDIGKYHPEVFVLCSIATTITRLGSLKSKDYIRKLREWWDNAKKPDGLRQTVEQLADILPSHTKQSEAVAKFKNAVLLAAESIPELKPRESWINSCLTHVDSLNLLSGISEGAGSGQKRKREGSQEGGPNAIDGHNRLIRASSIESLEPAAAINPQAGNKTGLDSSRCQPSAELISVQPTARMAEVDKLEIILGSCLFRGINASRKRNREKARGMIRLTDTVVLHLARQADEDFKLEVCLCSSIGEAIFQAKMRSIEDLRNMLGDYLFEAMKASNWRKREERTEMTGCTSAVNVFRASGDDSKLQVMLHFGTGKEVFTQMFPPS